uniref:Uncharacterized protein n=1 Tax=Glossina pallidipes TaxID=7398 RepID=A0A1A9ZZN6_GLOPL
MTRHTRKLDARANAYKNILHACILMKINASPTAIATTKARICTSWHIAVEYENEQEDAQINYRTMHGLNIQTKIVRATELVHTLFMACLSNSGVNLLSLLPNIKLLQLKGFVTFFDINVGTNLLTKYRKII